MKASSGRRAHRRDRRSGLEHGRGHPLRNLFVPLVFPRGERVGQSGLLAHAQLRVVSTVGCSARSSQATRSRRIYEHPDGTRDASPRQRQCQSADVALATHAWRSLSRLKPGARSARTGTSNNRCRVHQHKPKQDEEAHRDSRWASSLSTVLRRRLLTRPFGRADRI